MFITVDTKSEQTLTKTFELPVGGLHRTLVGIYVNADVEKNLLPSPVLLSKDKIFSLALGHTRMLLTAENVIVNQGEGSKFKEFSVDLPFNLDKLEEDVLESESLLIHIEEVYSGYHNSLKTNYKLLYEDLRTLVNKTGWHYGDLSVVHADCLTCVSSKGFTPFSPLPIKAGMDYTYVGDYIKEGISTVSLRSAVVTVEEITDIKELVNHVYTSQEDKTYPGEISHIVLNGLVGVEYDDQSGLVIELSNAGDHYVGDVETKDGIWFTIFYFPENNEVQFNRRPWDVHFSLLTKGLDHVHTLKAKILTDEMLAPREIPDSIKWIPLRPDHIVEAFDKERPRLLELINLWKDSNFVAPLVHCTVEQYLDMRHPDWKLSYPMSYSEINSKVKGGDEKCLSM